jgi:hypothetical protein
VAKWLVYLAWSAGGGLVFDHTVASGDTWPTSRRIVTSPSGSWTASIGIDLPAVVWAQKMRALQLPQVLTPLDRRR